MLFRAMQFEVRSTSVDEEAGMGLFSGYASTPKTDWYMDNFLHGCWKRTIDKRGGVFPLLWFHMPSRPIGLTTALEEDDHGLNMEGWSDLDTQLGKDTFSGIRKGYVSELSVGFDALQWRQHEDDQGRDIQEARLWEISTITRHFAANDEALISGANAIAAALDLPMIGASEGKPYANEHACRLKDPKKYSEFRRGSRKHEGKTYFVIYGKLPDNKWEDQAYRYPKMSWEVDEARKHCKAHDGKLFEPAKTGSTSLVEAIQGLSALLHPEDSASATSLMQDPSCCGAEGSAALNATLRSLVDRSQQFIGGRNG